MRVETPQTELLRDDYAILHQSVVSGGFVTWIDRSGKGSAIKWKTNQSISISAGALVLPALADKSRVRVF